MNIFENTKKYIVEIIIYNSLAPDSPYSMDRYLDELDEIKEIFTDYNEAIQFIKDEALSFGSVGNTIEILLNHDQIYYGEIPPNLKLSDDDLDLSESLNETIEIHDELNPAIWENTELKDDVRLAIEKIVNKFIDDLDADGIELKVKDILLLGSNANYNYTDKSDLDIHILADESSDCLDHHLPLIYNIYKTLFNNKYDISINDINVELYIEDAENPSHKSGGVYSLKNGWISEPSKNDIPEIDDIEIQLETDKWIEKFDELFNSADSSFEIENLIDELYAFRQDGLQENGEFSLENLVFKELRNIGYLDKLKDLRNNFIGKELSLD